MASTRASISKTSKRPKINIIPPKQLFVDLTQDDTKTPSPKLQLSSPSAPNAPSKTPSTKDTSSSIDYIPKSPISSTSLSPNGYLNPQTSPSPRVSSPPPTQENGSIDITLTLPPITPLDVQFNTPSPSPPIIGHPILWNLLKALRNGNPSRVNIKQLYGRISYALSWKPSQGDSLNLPDHRYKRRCCSPIPAKSDSLPHANAQTIKTYYKHQDLRIKKAQELKIKTSANSDIKDTSSKTKLRGRLLASFQDDAKYEHVGQDTRSQGGKGYQDKQGKD
ncbi:hypothetical protein Tco_1318410 [Tanacetum coccineum]